MGPRLAHWSTIGVGGAHRWDADDCSESVSRTTEATSAAFDRMMEVTESCIINYKIMEKLCLGFKSVGGCKWHFIKR